MEMEFSREQVQRIENSHTIEYLTTVAGAMQRTDAVSAKDINDFRVSLRNFQLSGDFSQSTLLTLLAQEKSAFLQAVVTRYGESGLCSNLFRFSLMHRLSTWQSNLDAAGESMIRLSQLFFNQPFAIFQERHCERKVLLSGVLIELAEIIAHAKEELERAKTALRRMQPADLAIQNEGDIELDLTIAQESGFATVQRNLIPLRSERIFKASSLAAATSLTDYLEDLLVQLRQNTKPAHVEDLINRCSSIKSELAKLSQLDFPVHPTIEAWEGRRFSFCQTLAGIDGEITTLLNKFILHLTPASMSVPDDFSYFTGSMRRLVEMDLIRSGVGPLQAKTAWEALVSYCSGQGLNPLNLVPAELGKINPHLSERHLVLLRQVDHNAKLFHFDSHTKQMLLTRSSSLMKYFKGGVGLVSAFLMIMVSSCGLKTLPINPADDYRPEIPFRDTPATPPDTPKPPVQSSPSNKELKGEKQP